MKHLIDQTDQRSENRVVSKRRRVWAWIIAFVLISAVVLGVIGDVMVHRAMPILKSRVIETLSTRFNSRVEMDGFNVSLVKGLDVSGTGLRIYPQDEVVAAGATEPLITLRHFAFHANWAGLFATPMHLGAVYVMGMVIQIPPKEMRAQAPKGQRHLGQNKIVVAQIVFDDSKLVIGTLKPNKDPQDYELSHIVLRDVGPEKPWDYDATLVNAIPKGDIHATGTFGPWNNDSPGDSTVTGHYRFDHADLNTIKGLGGILASVGEFTGQLDNIVVDGTTETPDFSLDTANYPMSLHTKFHAIVDGTNGNTYLQPVDARLGESDFSCSGEVINCEGKGTRH